MRTPDEQKNIHDGIQRKYRFANGYGASAVCHSYSYGGNQGLWELAVLDRDGHLTYDTPITHDVIGYLSVAEVEAILDRIDELPEAPR